jgi:hypothetical protein
MMMLTNFVAGLPQSRELRAASSRCAGGARAARGRCAGSARAVRLRLEESVYRYKIIVPRTARRRMRAMQADFGGCVEKGIPAGARGGASQKLDKQDTVARASRACSGSSAGILLAFRE